MSDLFTDEYGDIRPIFKIGCATLLAGALFMGWPAGCYILNEYTYSEGTRVGVINKFSKKGTFWKTYEGQMALEGIVSSGDSVGANVWDFSLDNQARQREDTEALAKKIQDYAESSTKVKMKYHEPWTAWPWRSSSNYHVQSVEPAEKK